MRLPIFKQSLVSTLWSNIEANFDLYMQGSFDDFLSTPALRNQVREVKNLHVNAEDFVNLIPKSGGKIDAHNANIIINAFADMTPNQAFDERIWVAATHTYGLEFTRERWLKKNITKEKNITSIKRHFFARVDGSRGIHRNNAISSLWWYAHIVKRNGEEEFARRLLVFLEQTDFRASIFERPSASKTPQVFEALLRCAMKKIESEPGTTFFTRKRNKGQVGPYLQWMKLINRWGGSNLYHAYSVSELEEQFTELMRRLEEEPGGS